MDGCLFEEGYQWQQGIRGVDGGAMRHCVTHDIGRGFLLCCYASDGHAHSGIVMENCVINGKSKRPIGLPRCAIVNTTDWNESTWKNCRFYLSPGEALMRVMDPEKDKKTSFVDCEVINLNGACSTTNLALRARASASSQVRGHEAAKVHDGKPDSGWRAESSDGQWVQLVFPAAQTVSEFRIREDPSSSITRYEIQYADGTAATRRIGR